MPKIENGNLIIGMDEKDHHYWAMGKHILETLLELEAPVEVIKKYVLEEPKLTDACPNCHKPTVKSYIIHCKGCLLWTSI